MNHSFSRAGRLRPHTAIHRRYVNGGHTMLSLLSWIITGLVVGLIARALVPRIFVRSPLACESRHGVCRRCYGMDLATGNLVEDGMAVTAGTLESAFASASALSALDFSLTTIWAVRISSFWWNSAGCSS